jgi:hypothetical protein
MAIEYQHKQGNLEKYQFLHKHPQCKRNLFKICNVYEECRLLRYYVVWLL